MRPLFLLLLILCTQAPAADKATAKVRLGTRSPIQFSGSTPQSSTAQLSLRLRYADEAAPYDLAKESFEIIVPRGYKEAEPHGLFIWISPGERPAIPAEWEKVLADKKLIFIGALKSGNSRETLDRMRLAVDANHHVRQLYTVDPKRVYVSGHSGGARVASMLGVAYADMFTGAACFMGVNFFQPIQAKDGTMYEARYIPHPEIAAMAQQESRFAVITGEKDSNRDNTYAIYEQGFEAMHFKHVKLFDIPGQPHAMPSKDWLEKAVEYLDGAREAKK